MNAFWVFGLAKKLILPLCLFEGECYWKKRHLVRLSGKMVLVCRGDFPCNQKCVVAVHKLAYLNYDLDKLRMEHFKLWLLEK